MLRDDPGRLYAYAGYASYYGELAALGIAKGRPFTPDARMKSILERAAERSQRADARAILRRPAARSRGVAAASVGVGEGLVPSNGDFAAPSLTDLEAREVWFYQAIGASPAMFRRTPRARVRCTGSAARGVDGAYLDGGKTYKLGVPSPVPAKLFWSVTVYDAATRSQVSTGQEKGRPSLFVRARGCRREHGRSLLRTE